MVPSAKDFQTSSIQGTHWTAVGFPARVHGAIFIDLTGVLH
jgi:hypothetical protein